MSPPLDRRHWRIIGDRLTARFYVAEQSPSFRRCLEDEMEIGPRVALGLLTHRRWKVPRGPEAGQIALFGAV